MGISSGAYLPCGISLFDLCSRDELQWVFENNPLQQVREVEQEL